MESAIQLEKEQQRKKKHPPGLYLLFFTEMWERFSYYGLRGLLTLYLTTALVSGGLGFSPAWALSIYGFYTGACYFTPMIGGYLTDRFLGRRKAITIGGITMPIVKLTFLPSQNKPNISTLVGELYEENDPKRDSAFTIFYMGINVGSFLAPLVCGFLSENLFKTTVDGVVHYGFRYGFLAASIGMIIGQILFTTLSNRFLGDIGKKPTRDLQTTDGQPSVGDTPLTKKEKQRTAVIVILTCFVVFFWAGFEQAGSSLTLYTNKFVDRSVFGWEVPTSWFQSVNPLFIILLAPVISALWAKLATRKRGDLKIPTKMGLGMILLGIGYIILVIATLKTGSDEHNITEKANLLFIVFTYLFHTLGELFLSPVGLSMVSALAPVKLASLLMGVWLASSGIANILGGQLASFTTSLGYAEVFTVIGAVAIVLGCVLLLISKKLVKWMD